MAPLSRSVTFVLGALIALLPLKLAAESYNDPPGRVAYLSDMRGSVSFSPAGESEWLGAEGNRPLVRGDRLWADRDARAELQIGAGTLRLDAESSIEIVQIDDRRVQLQLTQGSVSLRVRRILAGESFEINTPTLAFVVTRSGRYRVDVEADGSATAIVVWEGAGNAYGDSANFPLRMGDAVRFYDTSLRDYELFDLPRGDGFDRYAQERDARYGRSESARYVGDGVVGYAELDAHGGWQSLPRYGSVWFPTRVNDGWAPYRDGHWIWQEPWGWTWVDDQPWGFAPSHYGRWVSVNSRWGWIPGPRNQRAVYAPALVAFVGGRNWGVSIVGGGTPIGWFPLGPREVYVPPYRSSQNYFTQVNITNTMVTNTTITNIYNTYASGNGNLSRIGYANRAVPDAITAIPSSVFVNAQPVRQAAVRMDRSGVAGIEVTRRAAFAPSARSVMGATSVTNTRPQREVLQRGVIARTAPPLPLQAFAQREQQLQRKPGQGVEVSRDAQNPRSRGGEQRVRVVGAQPGAINVRETVAQRAEPRGQGGSDRVERKPLERGDDAARGRPTESGGAGRGNAVERDSRAPAAVDARDAAAASEQQANDRRRDAQRTEVQRMERQAADVQQAQANREQQQAKREQQVEREAQDNRESQAEAQRAERERRSDVQQQTQRAQQAERDKSEQRDSQAEVDRVERQRQGDAQQQANRTQQLERERKAQRESQVEVQRVERQRQNDLQEQANREQQAERQRANQQRQAVQQQTEQAQRTEQQAAQQQAERDQQQAAQARRTQQRGGAAETEEAPAQEAQPVPQDPKNAKPSRKSRDGKDDAGDEEAADDKGRKRRDR